MTKEQAELIAQPFLNDENKTVIVTSDYAVYLNNEVEQMEQHALNNKLECFVIKNEVAKVVTSKPKK
jgi:hypothetical protein